MGQSVDGSRPKWTPDRYKTPSLMKIKLSAFHYVRGNSSSAKTHQQSIKWAQPIKGKHISFLMVFFVQSFFFILCISSNRTQLKLVG
jgi:hypothetical protein